MIRHGLFVCLAASTIAAGGAARAGTLDQVRSRGYVTCGVNPGLAGFGIPDDKGAWSGLDIDMCRWVVAAVFGDVTKVKFIPLTAKDRATALQSGEIDVLTRNTTWTESREVETPLLFAGVNYYDGQGFMVRKSLNLSSALELNGATICVQQGTTTELNLADYFRANSMKFDSVVFGTADEALKAYDSGRCDAFTSDTSALYAERVSLTAPDDSLVLPEIISREPLGPQVRQGDDQWFNIVKWSLFAALNAEELGVSQRDVDAKLKSESPEVRRLLGVEGDFGKGMGLKKDWAYQIVKLVGNYGESFDRNLGEGSRLKIKRGLNALWSKGGVQYAPPIR